MYVDPAETRYIPSTMRIPLFLLVALAAEWQQATAFFGEFSILGQYSNMIPIDLSQPALQPLKYLSTQDLLTFASRPALDWLLNSFEVRTSSIYELTRQHRPGV